jgi:hypothetical protein
VSGELEGTYPAQKAFRLLISELRAGLAVMSEEEQKPEKKKKRKRQLSIYATEKVEDALLPELVKALDELEKEKKYVDVRLCPNCKSPKVRRVGSLKGDMSAHMGLTPPKYECIECGWRERLVVKATNRPTSVRDVVIIAEANEAESYRKKRGR